MVSRKLAAVRKVVLAAGATAAMLMSCDRQPTAPDAAPHTRFASGVAFTPVFPRAFQQAGASALVPFVKVRIRLVRGDGVVAIDTVIAFPADAETIPLSLAVPLSPSTTASGESMTLTLQYINAADEVVFTGGPASVNVAPPVAGSPKPVPVDVPVSYTGVGASATHVVMSPKIVNAFGGDPLVFAAQALDASNAVVPGTPIVFSAADATLLSIAANGTGSALAKRGTTTVTAQLLTGPSDNATVTVSLRASALATVSGSGQSGTTGVTLAQPVKVRATASDGLGVQGVAVTFAAGNGGSVGAASVLTDANGDAQTTWTMGGSAGTQTLTASAAGLTGSPVSFTATAVSGTATALAFTTQPASAASGGNIGPVVVTVRDAQGNTVPGFSGAVSLALAGGAAGALLSGSTSVNAVAGVATFPNLAVDRTGSGYTLTASSAGLPAAASAAFSITSGPAVRLVFTGQPLTTAAGNPIGGPVVVAAVDAAGNTTTFSGTINLALAANGFGGVIGGVTSAAASSGTATFTGATVARAGSYQLAANAAGLTAGLSVTFAVVAGAPSTLTLVSGGGQTAGAGATLAPTTVAVADAFANAVQGFTVGFTPAAGNGTTVPTSAVTNASGQATTTWTLGAPIGTQSMTASGAGVTSLAISATATGGGGVATQLQFTTQPTSAVAGTAISPAIVVSARDINGVLVASFTGNVTLAITTNPGGGVLSGTTTAFMTGGIATFAAASINLAGNGYVLGATTLGLSAATSTPFNITAGTATQFVYTTQPSTTADNVTMTPPVVVTARDAFGNTATGFTGTVSLAFGNNPVSATLLGTTSVAAVAGVATFANLAVDQPGNGFTVVASSGSLLATSGSFNIVPGAATHLAFTSGPSTTSSGVPISPPVVVSAFDAFGFVATSFTGNVDVAFGANPGGGTLSGTTIVAAVAGVATFSTLSIANISTGYTLVASSGTLTNATSASFDITALGLTAIIWTNPAGGAWSTASNWNLNRIPTVGDSVVITLAGTYGVTMNVNFTGAALVLGGASGTQQLSLFGRALTLSNALRVNANGTLVAQSSTITGAITNFGLFTLDGSTAASAFANQGTLSASATSTISGALTTATTSVIHIGQLNGNASTASLATASGFTNNGTIDLTTVATAAFSAQLFVINGGTVTNSATGTINALLGATGGGARSILGAVDNQGTISVATTLTLNQNAAVHSNSGTINLTGGSLSIIQSGASPSFTNSGTIAIGAGQGLIVSNGTFTQSPGASLGGAGSLSLIGVNAAFSTPFTPAVFTANTSTIFLTSNLTTATMAITLTSTVLNGAVTLTNAAGQTLSIDNSTIGFAFDNQGTVFASGVTIFSGAFTTGTASILRVGQLNGSFSTASLTVVQPFTNNGTIDLTTITAAAFGAQVSVTNGVLTNAATGVITASPGTVAGGARNIFAALSNQGSITVSTAMTINKVGAVHTNSAGGTISISGGNLTIAQNAGSMTNTASISIAAGRTLTINGGTFNQDPGTSSALGGAGALVLTNATAAFNTAFTPASFTATNSTVALASNLSSALMAISFAQSTVNGPVTLTNAASQSMTLDGTTINTAFDNQGTLTASATTAINGTLTTGGSSTITVGQINGNTSTASLTVLNGFTNNGAINLSTVIAAAFNAQLVVTNGTLTNAPGATIASLPGAAAGGTRTLFAELANGGTLQVSTALTINKASAAHTNNGAATINVAGGDLTITQSGTAPSFTNTAAISVSAGRTLTIINGTFNQNPGTSSSLNGGALVLTTVTANVNTAFAPATLSANGSTITLASNLSTAAMTVTLTNSTLAGAVTLTNASGSTLTLDGGTINTTFVNQGTLVASGVSAIGGTLTTNGTSVITVGQINGTTSTAILTVANGFTNSGTINLTTAVASAFSAQLAITTGSLINAALSSVNVLGGAAAGGARTLAAQLSNSGTITVSTPLSINKASAAHVNGGLGVINITGGDVTVTQSGTTPAFTSSGTITVSAARNLIVNGGTFTLNPGTSFTGAGGLTLNTVVANFNAAFAPASLTASGSTIALTSGITTSATALSLTNTSVSGAVTIVNSSGVTMTLDGAIINPALNNQGTVTASGASTLNGTVTTSASSVINIGQINGSVSTATLTIANGFTNSGTINITNAIAAAFGSQLVVTTGTVSNTGTIATLAGTLGGGTRTIAAQISNLGTININVATSLAKASASHSNGGIGPINVNANLTVTQTGTAPSFANSGPIAVASGATLAIIGGSFSHAPGTSSSITGAGSVILSGVNASFTGATFTPASLVVANTSTLTMSNTISTNTTALSVQSSTIGGTGAIINNVGAGSLGLDAATINVTLTNQTSIIVTDGTSVNGTFTSAAGSIITVANQTTSAQTTAQLIFATGFTNNGLIDLSNSSAAIAKSAQLTISSGTITNSATGEIRASTGTLGGGTRTVIGTVSNQGLMTLYQTGIGNLSVNGALTQTAAGTVNLRIGGLTAGTQYDQLVVSGAMNPAGTLTVTLANGFVPSIGQSFTIVTRGAGAGTFTTLNLPTLPSGTLVPTYNAGTIVLTVQ